MTLSLARLYTLAYCPRTLADLVPQGDDDLDLPLEKSKYHSGAYNLQVSLEVIPARKLYPAQAHVVLQLTERCMVQEAKKIPADAFAIENDRGRQLFHDTLSNWFAEKDDAGNLLSKIYNAVTPIITPELREMATHHARVRALIPQR